MKNPLYILLSFAVILACVKKPEEMTGPTIGSINIMADESIRYIIEQEENIFERTYKYANLDIRYLAEFDLFQNFMTDSIRAIIATRPLVKEEVEYFERRGSYPQQTMFATGALAFVVHRDSPDSLATYEKMFEWFRHSGHGRIFVIENVKSGISRELLELLQLDTLPSHFYSLNSKDEVIEYVKGHKNAIGIIDWSEISDSDNPRANEILRSITLMGISRPLDSLQFGYLRPYQYNLQDRKYPFTRDLYYISRTGMSDVSTGFISFIAGEIGQKIILKSGLLPRYQSERILEIRNTPDIKVIE